MAKTTTVPNTLIPYQAGVAIVTLLDANHRPMYQRSVATPFNYVASTQTTVTRTTEEIENGNGQNKTVVNDETYTFVINMNAFSTIFHNTITNSIETLPARALVLDEFTWNLPATSSSGLSITFGEDGDIPDKADPAPHDDGEYWFVVMDAYGNPLVRRDTPENGAYAWDPDTKSLTFSDDYLGAEIRVIYEYASTNTIRYESNPILSQPEFQIDTYGITSDANSDRKVKRHERILRASPSGDLSNMPTQKSRATTISYTFQSNPVPSGTSVYVNEYTPLDDDDSAAGAFLDNVVNGGDDVFTGKP